MLKITNIELGGIDTNDYPDFVDAYIESAEIDGVELTDAEIEELKGNIFIEGTGDPTIYSTDKEKFNDNFFKKL